jgi:hypothetical protein
MRLPFPEHIPVRYAFAFAALLCMAQLLQGTSSLFSLCCFSYILIATFAFNLAGGFTRPSGGYVFFYAVLAVILGLFWKAFLGEPADSNLFRPLLTIQATLGGITAMLGAVYLSRKLTVQRAFLANMITDANMYSAAIGCMVVGLALTTVLTVVPYEGGSVLSALSQLNRFLPIAMILGVIYQIRKSGGSSSTNMVVWVSGVAMFASGIFAFSKQGIFTPPLCWLVAAASQRYRISRYQILGFVLMMSFMTYYLVPYSQYGRNYQSTSLTESKSEAFLSNIQTSISFLSDLGYVRQKYEETETTAERNEAAPAYFDTPQGLLGRLQMISMDDAIINVTEQNGPFGFTPIIMDFENFVPHFLWPEKPTLHVGNMYAHEIGMIGEEDTSTGISFSPIGEAFHLGRWVGIFIAAPILWIMLFTLINSLCGDVRKSPWGLLAIVIFAHIGPEGGLGGPIGMLWYGAMGIIFAALAAAYVMPILGSIFTSPGRTGGLRRIRPVRSIPRRVTSVEPSQSSGQ